MFRKCQWLGLALLVLSMATAGSAQVEDQQVGDSAELEKLHKKLKQKFVDILNSDKEPKKDDKAVLETMAQYFAFRVTWPEYYENIEKTVKEFDKEYRTHFVPGFAKGQRQPTFETSLAFHAALKESLRRVFARDFTRNRMTSMNAALMLPLLGKSKNEEISELLVGLVNDPKQNDAIKLYAMRGIKEFFPWPGDSTQGDLKRVNALTGFIERPWDAKGATPAQLEAFHYIRREAIRCLAQAQTPAVKFVKRKVDGQIAVTFLRVLAKDVLDPPPTLMEKCYASFGLCNMKVDPVVYSSDLTMYAAAKTLGDFVTAYQKDQGSKEFKKLGPRYPWKVLTDEWENSLGNLETSVKDVPASKQKFEKYLTLKDNNNAPSNIKAMLRAVRDYKNPDPQFLSDFRNNDVPDLKPTKKTPYFDDSKNLEVDLP